VLLPAWSVPRRRDSAEVIDLACIGKASGEGHRTIARRLDRRPGTVRGRLRRAIPTAGWIDHRAAKFQAELEPDLESPRLGEQAGSPFADAIVALAVATGAPIRRFGVLRDPWELALMITGGLLYRRPRDPPG